MEKLRVQCRVCGKELQGNSGKTYSCGCPNMMTVRGDTVSAVDMSDVIMLNSNKPKRVNEGLTQQDIHLLLCGKQMELQKENLCGIDLCLQKRFCVHSNLF